MARSFTLFAALVTLFAALWGSATAAAVNANHRRAIPPDQDPFYRPTGAWQSTKPGTVLKSRPIVAAFFGLIPAPVQAWQLLYRTTAINGSAIAGVTTVFKPFLAKKDRFVSFHTAYDSSATICNPSYSYQIGSLQEDLISDVEFLAIQAYLLSGYVVSSPDYEGPEAAFAPGHLEGMGVLDSMRAVTNFRSTLGLSANPAIVGVGYSGGAIATGWAAALQSSYASELPVKGWVHGGTPANLTGTLIKLDGTLFSGFLPAAIAGIVKPSAYGARAQPLIDRYATASGKAALRFASQNCAPALLLRYPQLSIFSTQFQTLGRAFLDEPTVRSILLENTLGAYRNETPVAPVFMYHAAPDEIIPYADASKLATDWCANGAKVKFTTFANGGHISTEILALSDALDFVAAAFAGTAPTACSRTTELDNTLDPRAFAASLEPLLVGLLQALADAGTKDANIQKNLGVLTGAP